MEELQREKELGIRDLKKKLDVVRDSIASLESHIRSCVNEVGIERRLNERSRPRKHSWRRFARRGRRRRRGT